MNRKFERLLTIAGFVLGAWSSSAALAGTVTIDPNSYAPGTDISTATPGVTLDYLQTAPNDGIPPFSPALLGPIYSVACPGSSIDSFRCVNPLGSEVFGHDPGPNQPNFVFYSYTGNGCGSGFGGIYLPNGGGANECNIAAFRADFTASTDSVSIVAPNCGSTNCDQVVLAAYDSSFNQIGLCALEFNGCGTLVSPGVFDLSVNTGSTPIAHVVIDGAFQGIDKFSYTTMAPEIEPASAASGLTLLVGGLLILRGRRKLERAAA